MKNMFAKDLQELRNKQPKMSNTLEGINRITEAEEWVNDLEERYGGNSLPQNRIQKKKNGKKLRQPKRPLGQH